MSILAILTYLDSALSSEYDIISTKEGDGKEDNTATRKTSDIITAQSFASIFLADDKILSSNHMTEFWY